MSQKEDWLNHFKGSLACDTITHCFENIDAELCTDGITPGELYFKFFKKSDELKHGLYSEFDIALDSEEARRLADILIAFAEVSEEGARNLAARRSEREKVKAAEKSKQVQSENSEM